MIKFDAKSRQTAQQKLGVGLLRNPTSKSYVFKENLMPITTEMITRAYAVSSRVYSGSISKNEALDDLVVNFSMNKASALDYIHAFLKMLIGDRYVRTINTEATELYLNNIHSDYGIGLYKNAINATKLHIDYYESLGHGKLNSIRLVLEKHINRLASLAVESIHTQRREYTTNTIIRDPQLANKVKQIYDYKCQVCGVQLIAQGEKYAEAAHIKPLGNPHNGSDDLSNIICLCPNHHKLFDLGGFFVVNNYEIPTFNMQLHVDPNHNLDIKNFLYHFDFFNKNT